MLDRLRARAQRSDEGFTLIELLIVIVILGILAAIVVFAVGNTSASATTGACQSDVKTVEVAQEANKAQKGAYAADVAALVTNGYLRDTPKSDHYTVTTDTDGDVIVTPATAPTVTGGTLKVGDTTNTPASICAAK